MDPLKKELNMTTIFNMGYFHYDDRALSTKGNPRM